MIHAIAQARNLGVLDFSFTITPCPLNHKILLILPPNYLSNLPRFLSFLIAKALVQ